MFENKTKDVLRAGTGFMMQLSEALQYMKEDGYVENLIPCYDHFEARSGEIRLDPEDIVIDDIFRFENASDPDDQSIAYAISSRKSDVKGVYVESYGLYHDELSQAMIRKLQDHDHQTLIEDKEGFGHPYKG